jgi:predicted nucleic-acid-binding protein
VIGLDTNVLLRWLIDESVWPDDNPGQTAAVARLLGDDRKAFFVNAIVLAETLWVLLHPMKQPRAVVLAVLDRLLALANVTVQHRDAASAARAAMAVSKGGIHDRLIGAINAEARCVFTVTFDKVAGATPGFKLLNAKG